MLEILEEFLQVCSDEEIRLALRKCAWGVNSVDFLSYKIFEGRIGISDAHKQAIESLSGEEISADSLCGFLSYFNASYVDHDLLNCLRSGDKWTEDKEIALKIIKQKLLKAPMRTLVNFRSTLLMYVDASETGFSIALLQHDSTKNCSEIVSFFNKNMTKLNSWSNKNPYERELFALAAGVIKYDGAN